MRVGFASRCTTPEPGTRLFGAEPPGPAGNAVTDDLHVRAAWLEEDTALLVLGLDIIWTDRAWSDALRGRVSERLGLPPEAVMVAASHAHATPQIHPGTHDGHPPDEAYAEQLAQRALEAAEAARDAAEPARLSLAQGRSRCMVHRRKAVFDPSALARGRLARMVANRPDFSARVDDALVVVRAVSESGNRPLGALVNVACHATVAGSRAVSADFPGALARELEARQGAGFTSVFLQGFCGDQRPALVERVRLDPAHPLRSAYGLLFDRVRFKKDNGPDQVAAFVRALADETDAAGPGRSLDPSLAAALDEVVLPLDDGGSLPVRVHCLRLARDAFIVAVEGEVFSSHARWLRREVGPLTTVLPVGCAGGMAGYLPDADALARGGYETDRSLALFGLPSRLAPAGQDELRKTMARALRRAAEA